MYLDLEYVDVNVIKEKTMNWDKPEYYMTVDEFAKLVAETLYESGYFKRDDLIHPEDIEAAFTSTAIAVAKSSAYIISKINKRKNTFSSNTVTNTTVKNFNELY